MLNDMILFRIVGNVAVFVLAYLIGYNLLIKLYTIRQNKLRVEGKI